jgi:hypothetical protein
MVTEEDIEAVLAYEVGDTSFFSPSECFNLKE